MSSEPVLAKAVKGDCTGRKVVLHPGPVAMTLCINGVEHDVHADRATPLAYVIRNELGLTGTKFGCGLEQCGACAVLVDGERVLSCALSVGEFVGRQIETVEGLRNDGRLSAVQRALVEARAIQCGYCTPGITIALTALLRKNPRPTHEEARACLADHLCRCGTHPAVLRAFARLAADATAGRSD